MWFVNKDLSDKGENFMKSMGLEPKKDSVRNKSIVQYGPPYYVAHEQNFVLKIILFVWRKLVDIFRSRRSSGKFNEYGLTTFVGRQGSGKTMSMVVELERIRKYHPGVRIMTNFGYKYEDEPLTDWQQLLDAHDIKRRNDAGVVFAIDEIQNEFDVYDSRNFNLDILKVITQQRKAGIKIIASSQVFTRVSKPLREQCFSVVECNTFMGRWTFQKCFDADDYNVMIDSIDVDRKAKVRRLWRRNFVQSDELRQLYDTKLIIRSMKKLVMDNKRNGVYD